MDLEKHIKIIYENTYLDKNINFFNLWQNVFQKIYPNKKPNFNDPGWLTRINKSYYLCKYFIESKTLDGSFLECGVFKGFSSLLLITLAKKIENFKIENYFLVDSFEGLSEILEEDKPDNKKTFQNQKGNLKANQEEVEKIFRDSNNVNIIKGWIPNVFDVLDENNKYKFVHLDVDLYKPTLESLDYVFDKIIENGILITDDYETPLFPGNKKAWEEFLSIRNIPFFVLPSGQAVIIKK